MANIYKFNREGSVARMIVFESDGDQEVWNM
jgi:hypothetical protein